MVLHELSNADNRAAEATNLSEKHVDSWNSVGILRKKILAANLKSHRFSSTGSQPRVFLLARSEIASATKWDAVPLVVERLEAFH